MYSIPHPLLDPLRQREGGPGQQVAIKPDWEWGHLTEMPPGVYLDDAGGRGGGGGGGGALLLCPMLSAS